MNANSGMNIASGLLKGYMAGKAMKEKKARVDQESADAKELSRLKQMEMKVNIQKMQMEQENNARMWDILTKGTGTTAKPEAAAKSSTGNVPGTWGSLSQSSTPFGSSFRPETSQTPIETQESPTQSTTSLSDILADPQKLAALKATGLDLTGIANLDQNKYQSDRSYNLNKEKFEFEKIKNQFDTAMEIRNQDIKESEVDIIDVTNPGTGAKGKQFVNKITKQPLGPVRYEVIDPLSPDVAGKLSLGISAQEYIPRLKDLTSTATKWELADARLKYPVTDKGRTIQSLFRHIVDARVRAATGASVQPTEWDGYNSQYLPSWMDSSKLKEDKVGRLGEWVDGYVTGMDPTGAVRKRLKGNDLPTISTKEEFNSLEPGEEYINAKDGLKYRKPK